MTAGLPQHIDNEENLVATGRLRRFLARTVVGADGLCLRRMALLVAEPVGDTMRLAAIRDYAGETPFTTYADKVELQSGGKSQILVSGN